MAGNPSDDEFPAVPFVCQKARFSSLRRFGKFLGDVKICWSSSFAEHFCNRCVSLLRIYNVRQNRPAVGELLQEQERLWRVSWVSKFSEICVSDRQFREFQVNMSELCRRKAAARCFTVTPLACHFEIAGSCLEWSGICFTQINGTGLPIVRQARSGRLCTSNEARSNRKFWKRFHPLRHVDHKGASHGKHRPSD